MVTHRSIVKAILEATQLSMEKIMVYVIYNNSAGLYIVDTYYAKYSDEKLVGIYFKGKKQ